MEFSKFFKDKIRFSLVCLSAVCIVLSAVCIVLVVWMWDFQHELKLQDKTLHDYDQNARMFYGDAVDKIRELNVSFGENKKRISILDASIDSKDKRWATIKTVRDAISTSAVEQPPILDLTKIASSVVDYSDAYDVPVPLVLSIIRRESHFKNKAVSHAGALGLMQVMPETGVEISADIGKRRYHLFNIQDNIRFGTYYIRKMLDRFEGDVELAVRAYNCGPTYVKKVEAGEYQQYPSETIKYLEAVMKYRQEYENMGL